MTTKEVRDQMVSRFIAGPKTTAPVLDLLSAIVASGCGRKSCMTSWRTFLLVGGRLAQLRYTRMVKTMRLFQPSHTTGRQSVGEDVGK